MSPRISLLLLLLIAPARADLTNDISALLSARHMARGQTGVQVVRLGQDPAGSAIVFQHNATTPLAPASNMKLLTTSAALDRLGGDFRFRTLLLQRRDDLLIVGDGDPTFGDAELLRPHGWTATTTLENWAELLKSRGITRVGDIVLDDSVFDQVFTHPGWPNDQLHKRYAAGVCGLNLNANCLDFYLEPSRRGERVGYRTEPPAGFAAIANTCVAGAKNAVWLSRLPGEDKIKLGGEIDAPNRVPISVTVHDPAMYFGAVFAETLAAAGIRVEGTVRRESGATDPGATTPLAVHETPIEVVLRRANKDSMNLYAEALLKRLGRETSGQPGSWANGADAVRQFLLSRAIASSEFVIDDGSGLSKENRISANGITRVLMADFYSPQREMFLGTLAVGGSDGTLDKRFRDDLRGRVFAKTGYIDRVRALSGFLRTRKGNWYAFSILINGPVGSEARQTADKIVAAIDKND